MEAGTNGTRMLRGQSIVTPLPSVNTSNPRSIEEETVEATTVVPVGLLSRPGGTTEAPPTEGAAVPNPSSDWLSPDWSPDGSLSTFLQTVRQVGQFGSISFRVNRVLPLTTTEDNLFSHARNGTQKALPNCSNSEKRRRTT